MPQIEEIKESNAHTLTVIHGILKQHAANQNKKRKKIGRHILLYCEFSHTRRFIRIDTLDYKILND